MFNRVWRGYLQLLQKFPTSTTATTTGVLMGTGDIISQMVIERKPLGDYDPVRSSRFVFLGFVVVGPLIRVWYVGLDRLYTGTKFAAFKMVTTDQLIMAPTILCTILTGMGFLRREPFSDIIEQTKKNFAPALMNNYKLWPAAQLINFYFIPLQHRVLFVNFIALFWNVYVAWISEKKS